MALAVLPLLGVGGMQLYKGQAPGSVKDERLAPRITETARFAVARVCAHHRRGHCGVNGSAACRGSNAVCHAFSAVGLGGFSTHDRSIAYFGSPAIELVLNRADADRVVELRAPLHRAAAPVASRATRQTRSARRSSRCCGERGRNRGAADPRWRVCGFLHRATPLGVQRRLAGHHQRPHQPGYQRWPVFAPYWMLFLSCIVCSTARPEVASRCSHAAAGAPDGPGAEAPHSSAPWRRCASAAAIPEGVGHAVLAFIFLYFMTVALLTFAMLLTGFDFDSSFSAIVASINNTAHGFGAAGCRAQLPCAQRAADLDLHGGDAARETGDLQRDRAVPAGVLAQVAHLTAPAAARCG